MMSKMSSSGHNNFILWWEVQPPPWMNVYSLETMLILPITSKKKNDKFHFEIILQVTNSETGEVFNRPVWVKLTQARVISNKRLFRKVDTIPEEMFQKIQKAFKEFT